MVIVNTLGSKICSVFGIRMSAGIFFMPILFCVADIISECFGKAEAKRMINISTWMILFLFLSIYISVSLPADKSYFLAQAYRSVFSQSIRMSAASFISFFVSQRLDVYLFLLFKKITKDKYLFIRNNVSTIISQFIDTFVFMFIAFYKMNENYTFAFVISLIIPYFILKIVAALLDTPFCYLGVWWIRGKR